MLLSIMSHMSLLSHVLYALQVMLLKGKGLSPVMLMPTSSVTYGVHTSAFHIEAIGTEKHMANLRT